ncbi:MAG: class I SAM-dependent methyltransferase [Chloroflexia bacterium]
MWVIRRDWRYRTFLQLASRRGGRLLDVGCGTGNFLRLARDRDFDVAGVDADRLAVQVARDRFGLSNTTFATVEQLIAEPPAERYDLISLFDVLEHLADPVAVVQGLARLLTPEGYLVITVPSASRWPALFDPYVDAPPHHLTLWTPQALAACIDHAGLRVRRVVASKVLGDDLLLHALWRFPALRKLGLLGTAATGAAYLVIAPALARLLSLSPRAKGFHLMGVCGSSTCDAH